jgi:hypothetical protein
LINFTVDGHNHWTDYEKYTIAAGALAEGQRLMPFVNRANDLLYKHGILDDKPKPVDAIDAFLTVHGGKVEFMRVTNPCGVGVSCYGETASSNLVHVFRNASPLDLSPEWASHELAHTFSLRINEEGSNIMSKTPDLLNLDGIPVGVQMRQNLLLSGVEIFANTYDTFVYSRFNGTNKKANLKRDFIPTHLQQWINYILMP